MTLTIVKCGGAALAQGPIELDRYVEPREDVCVVHGAGARITAALRAAGVEAQFVGGRRITSAEALPVVREAFREENELLCRQIGATAVGLLGDDLGLQADLLPGYGHVGMLRPFVPPALLGLIAAKRVPVVASLAQGPLNVNADDAASVLAVALGADRLIFVSDVGGVIVGGEVVTRLSAHDISGLDREVGGGMLPKLQAAVAAAREGVRAEVGATLVVA